MGLVITYSSGFFSVYTLCNDRLPLCLPPFSFPCLVQGQGPALVLSNSVDRNEQSFLPESTGKERAVFHCGEHEIFGGSLKSSWSFECACQPVCMGIAREDFSTCLSWLGKNLTAIFYAPFSLRSVASSCVSLWTTFLSNYCVPLLLTTP